MRENFQRLLLILAAIAVTVALLEVTLRIFVSDGDWIRVRRPEWQNNFDAEPSASEFEYAGNHYRLNTLGLRGPDFSLDKPASVTRLAIIGDSVPLGLFVEEADNFPSQLWRFFQQRGAAVEVLNFGWGGANPAMNYRRLTTAAAATDPDAVLVSFFWNDFGDYHTNPNPTRFCYDLPVTRGEWLAAVLEDNLRTAGLAGSLFRRLELRWRFQSNYVTQQYDREAPRGRCAYHIAGLLSRWNQAPVVILLLPQMWGPEMDVGRIPDEFVAALTLLGLRVIDLRDLLPLREVDRFVDQSRGHPKPLGHALLALAIWDLWFKNCNPPSLPCLEQWPAGTARKPAAEQAASWRKALREPANP